MKTLKEIRESHSRLIASIDDRFAVVVKTGKRFGVQYWTKEMIQEGKSINTDNSISWFIETL